MPSELCLSRSHGSHRYPNYQLTVALVINLLKKPKQCNSNKKWTKNYILHPGFSTLQITPEVGPSHCWCCLPGKPPGWLSLPCTSFPVTFLWRGCKVMIDCSKSQVALVLLRSKHRAFDPKYSVFEDVVELGFTSFTFLPISNVIQVSVNFLICYSHSHRTLLEAEYRGDCKKINWGNFWTWHFQKDLRGQIRWRGHHLNINPFLPRTFLMPRKNSLLPRL